MIKRVFILVLLAGWAGACTPNPYLRGLELKDESRYDRALAALQKIKPGHWLHRHAQKEIAELKVLVSLKNESEREAAAGNLEAAVAACEKILKLDPGNPGIKARQAKLQKQLEKKLAKEENIDDIENTFQANRFEEASRLAEELLKREPKNSRARELLGEIKKSWEEAKAVSAEHLERGNKHREAGDILRACGEFSLARAAWPRNPEGEESLNRIQAAVSEALAQNLKSVQELLQKGEPEKAREGLEINLRCHSHDKSSMELYPKVLRRLAIEAYNKSEYARAIEYFERERRYNPDDPTLRQYLEKAAKLLKELKRN